ncbi:MAG TPA: MbcA/ParS/Xre antitoxin family protein [Longimicrobium sp.]|jgi:putative toxin-antitoxin system antitoxin component (TIGR02293 family)
MARREKIVEHAIETFGSRAKAEQWLRRPNRALGNDKPEDLLEQEEGVVRLEKVLGRIDHGLFS